MKVSDLKLNQEVEINGHAYQYKGVQKLRVPLYGKVQKIVFEGKKGQKLFDLTVGSKELKVNGEHIELK